MKIHVVDTGIRTSCREFRGRAKFGFLTLALRAKGRMDYNGRATHVASLLAGLTVDVAKGASVISVKVLDLAGVGKVS